MRTPASVFVCGLLVAVSFLNGGFAFATTGSESLESQPARTDLQIKIEEETSNIRFGTGLNLGGSTVKGQGAQRSEGPFGLDFNFEYSFSSRWTGGLDHMRSLKVSPVSSAVGVSSIYLKNYYYTPQPAYYPAANGPASQSYFFSKSIVPYWIAGFGFAQSSLLPEVSGQPSDSAAGISILLKSGVELPTTTAFGLRSELILSSIVIGTGTINFLALNFGVYYNF